MVDSVLDAARNARLLTTPSTIFVPSDTCVRASALPRHSLSGCLRLSNAPRTPRRLQMRGSISYLLRCDDEGVWHLGGSKVLKEHAGAVQEEGVVIYIIDRALEDLRPASGQLFSMPLVLLGGQRICQTFDPFESEWIEDGTPFTLHLELLQEGDEAVVVAASAPWRGCTTTVEFCVPRVERMTRAAVRARVCAAGADGDLISTVRPHLVHILPCTLDASEVPELIDFMPKRAAAHDELWLYGRRFGPGCLVYVDSALAETYSITPELIRCFLPMRPAHITQGKVCAVRVELDGVSVYASDNSFVYE